MNFCVNSKCLSVGCNKGTPPPSVEELERGGPKRGMPNDFIPLFDSFKKKANDPTPLEDRFHHISALDRRLNGDNNFVGHDLEDFGRRMFGFRRAVVKYANA